MTEKTFKVTHYITSDARAALDDMLYTSRKSGVRVTQSTLISQALCHYWKAIQVEERLKQVSEQPIMKKNEKLFTFWE